MRAEVIGLRKSVRTFEKKKIPEQTMHLVKNFLQEDTGLFGVPITFTVLDTRKDGVSSPGFWEPIPMLPVDSGNRRMRRFPSVMPLRSLSSMRLRLDLGRSGLRQPLTAKPLKGRFICRMTR